MSRLSRLLPLLLLSTWLLGDTSIREYRTVLVAEPGGAGRATAQVLLEGCQPGLMVIPLPAGLGRLESPRLQEGPRDSWLEVRGQAVILHLPDGVAGDCRVSFHFQVAQAFPTLKNGAEGKPIPSVNRLFRHALVNTQETPIRNFSFEVQLPPGWRVQTIREQLPKLGKSETGPRVRLGGAGDRQTAALQMSVLQQGDDTSMVLEVTPNRRSFLWAVVGLLLGGLYLFFFRDLVARKA